MTGILVTKFKMGQIDVEDLELMAAVPAQARRNFSTHEFDLSLKNASGIFDWNSFSKIMQRFNIDFYGLFSHQKQLLLHSFQRYGILEAKEPTRYKRPLQCLFLLLRDISGASSIHLLNDILFLHLKCGVGNGDNLQFKAFWQ
jgi:hypothetical protein